MYQLLHNLCKIFGPSGNEAKVKDFILDYIDKNHAGWRQKPEIIHGEDFQDCIMVAFGKPKTVVFAHMDSIGFTTRYANYLVPIGGPEIKDGYKLIGEDKNGPIKAVLKADKDERKIWADCGERQIERGTELVFECEFKEKKNSIESCYLDNRLGVYIALRLMETLENGVICFSCWEEHGGGSVTYLCKYIYERWKIKNALIADITWVTEGVFPGKGVVISMRDKNIPRRSYINKIISIAENAGIDYQLEVEAYGSSDGRELQTSPYPFDWCFIGAPEEHAHTPHEKVNKRDIESMLALYQVLMREL